MSNALWWVVCCQPLVVWAVVSLLPTFDDWTYLTSPQTAPFSFSLLLPWDTYWRPFDGLTGYLVGRDIRLFPLLNHLLVLSAHLISTVLVYLISRRLKFDNAATNIAVLFFYFSPGMLGTVLDIDSINQASTLMWGLALVYVSLLQLRHRRLLMAICLFVAILCKENGLTFIIISPMLTYAFGKRNKRDISLDFVWLATVGILYLALRFCLPQDNVEIGSVYFEGGVAQKLRNIGMFLGFSWVPVDFVSLLHPPSRNLLLVVLTLALGIPFLAMLWTRQRRQLLSKPFIGLMLCALVAASMHLATIFTVMHTYAGLPFIALSVAYLFQQSSSRSSLQWAFLMWLASVLVTDVHHTLKAYDSGMTGKRMAEQVLEQTKAPCGRVQILVVDDNYPKYSMFCVIPYQAFGWGAAVRYATGYEWPQEIEERLLTDEDTTLIRGMAQEAFGKGYDGVWVICHDKVKVLTLEKTK